MGTGFGLSAGFSNFADDIEDWSDNYEEAVERAVEAVAEDIASKAYAKTPVEFGTLRDSQQVREITPTEYVISYHTKYAVYVHERTELDHDHGKEAKFLERAIMRWKFQHGKKGLVNAIQKFMD